MAYIGKRPQDTFPAGNAVTATTIAANAVGASELAINAVDTASIADGAVTNAKLAANAIAITNIPDGLITATQLANNAIGSDQIVDGAITAVKVGVNSVTSTKIAENNITAREILSGAIITASIADDAVTVDKMAGLARGKIIYGDASGNPAALGLGTSGQVLKSDGTDIAWGTDEGLTTEQVQDIAGGMFTGNTETGITATYQDVDGTIDLVVGTLNQDTTGLAGTATTLATARTIGGVSFDGSANISLPGVDGVGNQNTTGSAATLTTARTIGGVSFDGSANINLPGVNAAGSQDTSGTAALATSITASANNSTDETVYLTFIDGATGTQGVETDTGLTYNPSTGVLTTTSVTGNLTGNVTGNASGSAATVTSGTQAAITSAANLVTVGTIGTGVWQGTPIASAYIAGDAITGAKIADDAIDSEHFTDGSIDTAHIADDQVTAAKLADTAVTAASYGSATAIPTFTVDAQGRITAASTAAISSALTVAADSGTNDTVTIGTDTLTFEGTANEIETTVSNNKINIGLPTNVTIAGNLTVAGTQTTVSSTTITVADPLVALASGNNAADAVDIGLYGLYDTSGSQDLYSGLFRDASDSGKWKLFKDTQAAPTTTVDTSGTGYAVGTLVANIEGNLTGNTSGTSGSTTGNAATATALATARTIHGVSFDGTANIDLSEVVSDTVGAMFSSNTETGITATYQDADNTIDLVVGTLNQDTTGNAATATALATARTIHGVSFDGSANIDLSEVVSDTVGAMFTSNTETGITATYQDLDNTIDLVVGTLNQDTTGSAATLTTARTIGGVSFDGSANIDLPGVNATGNQNTSGSAATLTTPRAIGGVNFDGSAAITLPGVNSVGNQNTTGSAATLTTTRAIAVAGDVTGTANFDGSAGISITTTLATDAIVTANITDANITTAKIAADAVTQAKIADDAVGADQLAVNSVVSASIVNGSILGADIAVNTITVANIADNAVDATKIASNSILTRHIDDNQITGDQIADDIVLSGTGALRLPDGTTAQRPTGAAGMFRYNTTTGGFEGYTDEWGAIAGGGGASTFARKEFAGDGSTTAFTLDTAPADENDLMVFIEGVYQNQDAYSLSGTTLTMADAPVSGRGLVVYHVSAAVAGAGMAVNTMTGDNSDTTLTLAVAPTHVNNVQVFFDGVYQKTDTYTVSGTTLTFGVAPPTGVLVEARTHSQTAINTFPATGISGLTAVQPVAGDFMMILDATDAALKKADVKDIMATAVSITSAADAVALTFDSSENATFAGNITAVDLDISGNVDIDGTLEADAITVNGTTLAETISDTVGAMVTSNTESGITVTYDDADNTLDFTVGTLNQNTTGSAATLTTARTIGGTSFDGSANIAVGLAATATALATARTIHGVSFDGTANIDLSEVISDTVGAMVSSNTESGITVAYDDADNTLDFTVGTLNQNTTGSAATLTTARTIGGVSFDGSANIDLPGVNTAGNQNVDAAIVDGDNFKVAGAQGSDGQVLTSTGSGVAWEDAAGGVAGISSSADATAITITSGEEVGIGNASPQVKFVVGDGTNGTGLEVTPNESSGYVNMNAYDRGSSAWRTMNIGGDVVTLNTGGSERLRIDSSGNTVAENLYVTSDSSATLSSATKTIVGPDNIEMYYEASQRIIMGRDQYSSGHAGIVFQDPGYSTASGGVAVGSIARGTLGFATSNNSAMQERMRITSTGSVGINETSPDFSGFGSNGGGIELDDVGANFTAVRVSHGATGDFYMAVSTGAAYLWGKANSPIVFGTNNTERLRLDDTGEFLVNRTDGFGTGGAAAMFVTGRSDAGIYVTGPNTNGYTLMSFHNGGLNQIGSIKNSNNNATLFNTSSDYRLKENVDYTWDATTRLKQLKPARFNWISDDSNTAVDGFLAHEVSSIVPEAIDGVKDATKTSTNCVLNSEGNLQTAGVTEAEWVAGKAETPPRFESNTSWTASHTQDVYQGIDQSKLVPLLVKTIQELEARITTLENE